MGIVLDETKNKIFLAQNARGWDLPGWHIEQGESIIEALKREVWEEAGTDISGDIKLWWYKEYTSKKPEPNRDGWFYPLLSHILYFIVHSNGYVYTPHGEEIIASETFTPLDSLSHLHDEVDTFVVQNIFQ